MTGELTGLKTAHMQRPPNKHATAPRQHSEAVLTRSSIAVSMTRSITGRAAGQACHCSTAGHRRFKLRKRTQQLLIHRRPRGWTLALADSAVHSKQQTVRQIQSLGRTSSHCSSSMRMNLLPRSTITALGIRLRTGNPKLYAREGRRSAIAAAGQQPVPCKANRWVPAPSGDRGPKHSSPL